MQILEEIIEIKTLEYGKSPYSNEVHQHDILFYRDESGNKTWCLQMG